MNAPVAAFAADVRALRRERWHRRRLAAGYLLAILLVGGIGAYGAGYYSLPSMERPFSPRHALLKPSGAIGLKLGFTALAMFVLIFLYPLRKRWAWLGRQGSSRHWLDFHVLLGLAAPFVVALHASFKFRGLAGMAFASMAAVAASGVVGRYLYAQIPRRLSTAELSLKEIHELQTVALAELGARGSLPPAALEALLDVPRWSQVDGLSLPSVVVTMLVLDVRRFMRVAALRRHAVPLGERVLTLGGILRTSDAEVERSISIARSAAALGKHVAFLAHAQRLFRLWHVVHRPFSYTFVLLAAIHIAVVMMMGYF